METAADIDWRKLTRDLGPGLLSYFKATLPAPIAVESVQEVLLRLFTKTQGGEFLPEKGTLRMYAYGIARHVRHEASRAEGKFVTAPLDDVADRSTDPAIDDNRRWLRWAVLQLKPVEQEIILLLLDKELDYEAIGAVLDMPVGTVKSHVHRAKVNLKALLTRPERATKG